MNLGDQKIDVIIAKNDGSLIEKEAMKKGIELSLETLKLEKYSKNVISIYNESTKPMVTWQRLCL